LFADILHVCILDIKDYLAIDTAVPVILITNIEFFFHTLEYAKSIQTIPSAPISVAFLTSSSIQRFFPSMKLFSYEFDLQPNIFVIDAIKSLNAFTQRTTSADINL
jgi:hypothetical protein